MQTKSAVENRQYASEYKPTEVVVDPQPTRLKKVVRSWLYDHVLTDLTTGWYQQVFSRLPAGSRLLDIGIGTGGAVSRNAELIRSKRIKICGIDIDRAYLGQCNRICSQRGLSDHIETAWDSVYSHHGGPYDAAYFSASFMLLSDPLRAIKQVCEQLTPEGRIFFTQTFHHDRSALLERLKPMLHRFTTIHFGTVTYENDFRHLLERGGLELEEWITMGRTRGASFQLAMARPVTPPAVNIDTNPIIEPFESQQAGS